MFLNGRCYVAVEEATTYSDASQSCNHISSAHGHLAFAINRELVKELYDMALGDDRVRAPLSQSAAYFILIRRAIAYALRLVKQKFSSTCECYEKDFFQRLPGAYYVGAYQTSSFSDSPGNGWQWIHGENGAGPRIPYDSDVWRRGEPDDNNGRDERAAAIAQPGGIDDVPEDAEFFYICEYHD